ncbi:MAG: hypothetical protein KDB27_01320 [Planctomycetales bacterium]|nr:hypothetical protein [Planctomycetales bacterium]
MNRGGIEGGVHTLHGGQRWRRRAGIVGCRSLIIHDLAGRNQQSCQPRKEAEIEFRSDQPEKLADSVGLAEICGMTGYNRRG